LFAVLTQPGDGATSRWLNIAAVFPLRKSMTERPFGGDEFAIASVMRRSRT
jgi:hypothetical protein